MCTLYDRIQTLCKSKGVSGSRMCLDLGLSKSTLSDIKSGRKKGVSTDTAMKMATYLGVSVGYLLGEEEKEKSTTQMDDGLTDSQKALIAFAKSVPDDKAAKVLHLMQAILADDW